MARALTAEPIIYVYVYGKAKDVNLAIPINKIYLPVYAGYMHAWLTQTSTSPEFMEDRGTWKLRASCSSSLPRCHLPSLD